MRAPCGGRGESQRTCMPGTGPLAPSPMPAHIVRASRGDHLPQRPRVGDVSRWRGISQPGPGRRDVRKRMRILAKPGTQNEPTPRSQPARSVTSTVTSFPACNPFRAGLQLGCNAQIAKNTRVSNRLLHGCTERRTGKAVWGVKPFCGLKSCPSTTPSFPATAPAVPI
jgi:hypothetical protein